MKPNFTINNRSSHFVQKTFENNKSLETYTTAVHKKGIAKHTLEREPSRANHKKKKAIITQWSNKQQKKHYKGINSKEN